MLGQEYRLGGKSPAVHSMKTFERTCFSLKVVTLICCPCSLSPFDESAAFHRTAWQAPPPWLLVKMLLQEAKRTQTTSKSRVPLASQKTTSHVPCHL